MYDKDVENSNNVRIPYNTEESDNEEEDEIYADVMTLLLALGRLSSD